MPSPYRDACPKDAEHPRHPENWYNQSIHTPQEMDQILVRLLAELSAAGYSGHDTFSVRLAMEEAIINAIRHGHHQDMSKEVKVRYQLTAHCLIAEIEDQGAGFRPEDVPNPLAPENLEREGGRGLFLMRCYMTSVRYNAVGNRVTLCKERSNVVSESA
jgi:serine/threonine-protein kinase RsbW